MQFLFFWYRNKVELLFSRYYLSAAKTIKKLKMILKSTYKSQGSAGVGI